MASPVASPTRVRTGNRPAMRRPRSASWTRRPARTALAAAQATPSGVPASGPSAPNTAITASPMNFSTTPPAERTAAETVAK